MFEVLLDGVPFDLDEQRDIVLLKIVDGFPTEVALVDLDGSVCIAKVNDVELEVLHDYNIQFNAREKRRPRPVRFVKFFGEETNLHIKSGRRDPIDQIEVD